MLIYRNKREAINSQCVVPHYFTRSLKATSQHNWLHTRWEKKNDPMYVQKAFVKSRRATTNGRTTSIASIPKNWSESDEWNVQESDSNVYEDVMREWDMHVFGRVRQPMQYSYSSSSNDMWIKKVLTYMSQSSRRGCALAVMNIRLVYLSRRSKYPTHEPL